MRCAEVQEMLPAYAREGGQISLGVRRHLARCPECKAELARYEALSHALGNLASVSVEPPPGLERALIAIPQASNRAEQVVRHVRRNRRAYTGGVAVALVGATSATILLRRRSRLAAA